MPMMPLHRYCFSTSCDVRGFKFFRGYSFPLSTSHFHIRSGLFFYYSISVLTSITKLKLYVFRPRSHQSAEDMIFSFHYCKSFRQRNFLLSIIYFSLSTTYFLLYIIFFIISLIYFTKTITLFLP